MTVISFEDSTNSKIHTLPLALGSASLSVKDIDIYLEMQQFCCAAIDENILNYFKRKKKKRRLEKSIKSKYWKVFLHFCFALSTAPRIYATKQNIKVILD